MKITIHEKGSDELDPEDLLVKLRPIPAADGSAVVARAMCMHVPDHRLATVSLRLAVCSWLTPGIHDSDPCAWNSDERFDSLWRKIWGGIHW